MRIPGLDVWLTTPPEMYDCYDCWLEEQPGTPSRAALDIMMDELTDPCPYHSRLDAETARTERED